MKDDLGKRMKEFYEIRTRTFLPRRTYTIIRIDGKAFHTYTRGLKRPFDDGLIEDMDLTTKYLCENIQGCKLGYVQSDEISLLLTDFDNLQTCAWFDGQVQKIVSVSASLATAKFNQLRILRELKSEEDNISTNDYCNSIECTKLAHFDSRVFTIPNINEVGNYFIWRQKDAERNSIQSLGQSLYSHKELENKNSSDIQEMCFQKGHNWNDLKPEYKRGRLVLKQESGEWNIMRDIPIFSVNTINQFLSGIND